MPMQSLAEAITEILIASRKPLLARDIADQLNGKGTRRSGRHLARRDINQAVYQNRSRFEQDASYRWRVRDNAAVDPHNLRKELEKLLGALTPEPTTELRLYDWQTKALDAGSRNGRKGRPFYRLTRAREYHVSSTYVNPAIAEPVSPTERSGA
jgi:hypothetical protein